METINGCTVIPPPETPDPITLGPDETRGSYVAMVGMFPPGEPGPPPHLHPHTDETFYMASGEATFLLGDREMEVAPGSTVFVPRGTRHTVWNSGEVPVRGVILVSPVTPSTSSSPPSRRLKPPGCRSRQVGDVLAVP